MNKNKSPFKSGNMELTEEMKEAISYIESGENIFITGNAGTGKTVFLKHIQSCLKHTVVTAPTGIAAINAGGVTIHSLALIRQGQPLLRMKWGSNRKVLETITTLIIDEVSMVRCDLLDLLDKRLQEVKDNTKPFGGVQIIMFGDLFQLPPVKTPSDIAYLEKLYPKVSGYFFYQAKVWKRKGSGFRICSFTKIFRQTDTRFIDFLGRLRTYSLIPEDYQYMSSRVVANIDSYVSIPHICSTNQEASNINLYNMKRLLPQVGEDKLRQYDAVGWCEGIDELSPKDIEKMYPCESSLFLLPGAKVIILVNENTDRDDRYVNGSLGEVMELTSDTVKVRLDSGRIVDIGTYTWETLKYSVVGRGKKKEVVSEKIGECTQIPLKLAWGITIHKSQGLTFDKIAVHNSRIFEAGQLYVAISRCRNYDGLYLSTYVSDRMIKQFPELLDFLEEIKKDSWYTKGG